MRAAPAALRRRVATSVSACSGDTPGARRARALKASRSAVRGCPAAAAAGGVNGGTTNGVQNSTSGVGK